VTICGSGESPAGGGKPQPAAVASRCEVFSSGSTAHSQGCGMAGMVSGVNGATLVSTGAHRSLTQSRRNGGSWYDFGLAAAAACGTRRLPLLRQRQLPSSCSFRRLLQLRWLPAAAQTPAATGLLLLLPPLLLTVVEVSRWFLGGSEGAGKLSSALESLLIGGGGVVCW
jgi:hypothetical protein